MSPAPSPDSSFVHLNIAQSLENVGDASALHDMLVMLHDVLTKDTPQIALHMEEHDFPAAQHLLHALKGCIPIFCTQGLCDELIAVELLSKSPMPQASAVAYGPLRLKLEALSSEIALQLRQSDA
jgi:hypothetical protein